MLGENEKPDVTYADVGGLDMQKQEIREAVELPLTHFDLYRQIGRLYPSGSPSLRWERMKLTGPHRYRSASWCVVVWSSWYRQDHVGQGCGQQHHRQLHSCEWL